MKEIKKEDFPFGTIMESMKGEALKKRIKKAWDWPMDKLTLVPYVGEIAQTVEYAYPELTALCPVTGIQDLYDVRIRFIPNKHIPELKSLKFYFMNYRNLPISHEHIQAKIFKEFRQQIEPMFLEVELLVAVRGGIYTKVQYGE
ncbi:MAG: putative NADPH-dependent 7-cyano-7-deazaguanine reductase [Prokaryotic dsDNA virus sp.]|jgi:7-cyano-7-deazaguanine reductase|nr:MAG: putative NADPH-dependent 7-cyano-7-deazaguanine reductase [Prokaryotic dsDNA virus sp.]|tara:strand:+ start:5586 stop:6017 length:432 start_codon:yes stop_codon:yes gene_type:complete